MKNEFDIIFECWEKGLKPDLPTYNPPYDSPIEDDLAYHIVKYLSPEVKLLPQYNIETYFATYRVDFYLESGNKKIVIECDGKKYHNSHNDLLRDTLILGTRKVDAIVRLRGKNITYDINDCIYILMKHFPNLFSERGKINLNKLASKEIKDNLNTSKPFQVYKLEFERETDNKLISYDLVFEIHNFNWNEYYYYSYLTFWNIIKFNKFDNIDEIETYFQDIEACLENHFSILEGFSPEQRKAYRRILNDTQIIYYG